MSTIDESARVIDRWLQEHYVITHDTGNPRDIAQHLANAGLLAPDLPGPITPGSDPEWAEQYRAEWELVPDAEWHPTNDFFINVKDGHINAGFGGPQEDWDGRTPNELRAIAHALIAAAQHAEEGKK